MPMRIPIGVDDFRELREGGLEYVDKTHLIQEIIDRPGVKVMLVPRPRRFGKSVNLSMLRVFFEKREEDLWPLFEGLRIDRAGGAYRAHFQRYPVVSLSFKGIKPSRFADCRDAFIERIITLFDQHRAVLDSAALSEVDQRRYRQILDGTASSALYAESLFHLTAALQRAHGERAIVLIDEYDAPIHAAWQHGYYNRLVNYPGWSGTPSRWIPTWRRSSPGQASRRRSTRTSCFRSSWRTRARSGASSCSPVI